MSCAVSRWDTYLSETHCKLRRSAAVGKQRRSHTLLVPRSGTYVLSLISSWICQSRFAELLWWGGCPYPQLRCFAACSGFHYYRSRSAEPAAHTICIIFLSKDPVFPSKHKKGFRNLKSRNPFLLCQCYAAMPLTFFRLIT